MLACVSLCLFQKTLHMAKYHHFLLWKLQIFLNWNTFLFFSIRIKVLDQSVCVRKSQLSSQVLVIFRQIDCFYQHHDVCRKTADARRKGKEKHFHFVLLHYTISFLCSQSAVCSRWKNVILAIVSIFMGCLLEFHKREFWLYGLQALMHFA